MRGRQACYAGPNGALAEWLQGYARAGTTHFVLRFAGDHERHLETRRCGVNSRVDGRSYVSASRRESQRRLHASCLVPRLLSPRRSIQDKVLMFESTKAGENVG